MALYFENEQYKNFIVLFLKSFLILKVKAEKCSYTNFRSKLIFEKINIK